MMMSAHFSTTRRARQRRARKLSMPITDASKPARRRCQRISHGCKEDHHWPGLAAIGKVLRVRETGAKTTTETAYYLLSTALSADRFNEVARAHWGIESVPQRHTERSSP